MDFQPLILPVKSRNGMNSVHDRYRIAIIAR